MTQQLKNFVFSFRLIPVCAVLSLLIVAGCDTGDAGSAIQNDLNNPVVRIDGINEGDTLSIAFDASGNSFDIDLLDETELSFYSIEISLDGNPVTQLSDSASITQAFETIDISNLQTNTLYEVSVFVEDRSENTSTLNFYLLINFEEAVVKYENLYIVGTAVSGGYDLAQQSPMEQNVNNPNIFTWSDTLTAGEFKIKTYPEEDFCLGDWIHPPTVLGDLSSNSYEILQACLAGNTDYKWQVSEAGIYTVSINFQDETIDINQDLALGETIDEIFLVGSATPGEWDLASQTTLTQDSENISVFRWSGSLTAGEFKFKLYPETDFCAGKWIHPLTADQALTETDFEILVGCAADNPDYKWVLSESQAGNYSITINLQPQGIQITQN